MRQSSAFVSQLLQKYQMMLDRPAHRGMLPIRNAKLFGSVSNDLCQRSVMGVAHERAKMMHDVMVEAANQPADQWIGRRIIGRSREDVVNAVIKLAAIRGKVRAVDGMGCLEYQ